MSFSKRGGGGIISQILVLILLLPYLLGSFGLKGSPRDRQRLKTAVLLLAAKDFIGPEDRPRDDGLLKRDVIGKELRILEAQVPRWGEAMKLQSADPNHLHTIGEHQLRVLYHYARGDHARALETEDPRFFVTSLAVLLHDMGKLDSPRDERNLQKKDPAHPAKSAAYIRRHGRSLGLLDGEAEWIARLLGRHRDLGILQWYRAHGPEYDAPSSRVRLGLARQLKTRSNLDFLAAFTRADVLGINPFSYGEWKVDELLPLTIEEVAAELK